MEILGPKPPLSIISACRTAVFMGMSRDAVKLAGKGVRKSKDQLLFEEVVTEVDALQQIVGMAKLDSKFGFEEELGPAPKYWPFKSSGAKKVTAPKNLSEEKYWPFKKMSAAEKKEQEEKAFTH